MQFELLTLNGVKFQGTVSEVGLKTSEGAMAVLPHHEPFTAIVVSGPLSVRIDSKEELYATFGGIIEVSDNKVRLLADEAVHADELIETEIQEALNLALSLKDTAKDKGELHRAQTLIDRHAIRLEVARIRRHRSHQHRR